MPIKIIPMSTSNDEPLAFEGAVYDLLDLISSIADRAQADKEKTAVKRLNNYKACFKYSDRDNAIEQQQMPLYAKFADLYADRTDELTTYGWLKEQQEIVYVNKRGKPDKELSIDLTVLFRLCSTDDEMARFVCYFFDAVRFSTPNVSFGRSLERIIRIKEREIEEDEVSDNRSTNPIIQAMREMKTMTSQNPNFIGELVQEMSGMAEMVNTPEAQQLFANISNEDGSINMEAVPENLTKAGELLSNGAENVSSPKIRPARITRGLLILNKEALNLNRIVAEAIEQVNALIELKHQHLAIIPAVGPAFVSGDKTRLTQVFANLINNAAKYTPEYGHITVRIDLQQRDVKVTVRDDGVGISPELLPRIFDLFVQAERTLDRSQGGLGLGLSLVKKLMDLHGGAVAARSEGIGRGSEFTVRLPQLCEPALEVQSRDNGSTAVHTSEEAMHLMIVDDNADAANLLCLLVEELGHTTTVAPNASIALEQAHVQPPQMLFLDIGLPDMDGYELARRLRTMPETEEAVLVAVTGYGQWEDKERAKAAGFDHHVVKPINLTEITALIASLGHESSIKIAGR